MITLDERNKMIQELVDEVGDYSVGKLIKIAQEARLEDLSALTAEELQEEYSRVMNGE